MIQNQTQELERIKKAFLSKHNEEPAYSPIKTAPQPKISASLIIGFSLFIILSGIIVSSMLAPSRDEKILNQKQPLLTEKPEIVKIQPAADLTIELATKTGVIPVTLPFTLDNPLNQSLFIGSTTEPLDITRSTVKIRFNKPAANIALVVKDTLLSSNTHNPVMVKTNGSGILEINAQLFGQVPDVNLYKVSQIRVKFPPLDALEIKDIEVDSI